MKKHKKSQGTPPAFAEVELWPDPVDCAELLDEISDIIRRFIVCDEETTIAATLWIMFTWFIDQVQVAPIAVITAPQKRCGKTQLLMVMQSLVRSPLLAANITPAAIYRVIEAYSPTLLIDEADTFLRKNEEMRGVLNSGHTRSAAYVIRLVGDDHEPASFSTWGAKAISGIGTLPETLMDRAIALKLRRKLSHEIVEHVHHAHAMCFETLTRKMARLSLDAGTFIKAARPALPEQLNDRAQDNWEPLLAIADYAGKEWPVKARKTAVKISGASQEAISFSVELLMDIHEILSTYMLGVDRIQTTDLLLKLNEDESRPWCTFNRGKFMSSHQLAKQLKEFDIRSSTQRVGRQTLRCFTRSSFDDAFARYLPPPDDNEEHETPQQSEISQEKTGFWDVSDELLCSETKTPSETSKPLKTTECCGVANTGGVNVTTS